jgi:hypothetical protein
VELCNAFVSLIDPREELYMGVSRNLCLTWLSLVVDDLNGEEFPPHIISVFFLRLWGNKLREVVVYYY